MKESPAPRYVHFTDAFCLVLCDGIVVTLYGYFLMWVLYRSFFLPLVLPILLSLSCSGSPAFALALLLSLCREKGLGGSLGHAFSSSQ